MSYILSCCSTADLSKEHFQARDIHYVCFHYAIDGVEYPDDLGESIPFDEFYARMSKGADTRTAQVNVAEYVDFFTPFLEDGKDIIHVSLSSGISGTINAARNAAAILRERYPERKIYVIDSLGASSGYGLLMDTAAAKRDEGLSVDEMAAWIEENRLKVHHWFFSTDLSFYVKGGRISKTAGFFGSVLEICPLLNMDALGRLTPRFKIRTKKRVIREIQPKAFRHLSDNNYLSKWLYARGLFPLARILKPIRETTLKELASNQGEYGRENWSDTDEECHIACLSVCESGVLS